uniref:Ribonuclease P n=1 Tax=Panagrolaimus sp. JU765 TaxID=591449 RepID=A0AC34QNE5_9BILA
MAPKKKETGYRELTVKLEFKEPIRDFCKEDFVAVVRSALSTVFGKCIPEHAITSYSVQTKKGTLVMNAEDLSMIWAALSIYGEHDGQIIAFHYYSIKE